MTTKGDRDAPAPHVSIEGEKGVQEIVKGGRGQEMAPGWRNFQGSGMKMSIYEHCETELTCNFDKLDDVRSPVYRKTFKMLPASFVALLLVGMMPAASAMHQTLSIL
jgi:hypothetical protein